MMLLLHLLFEKLHHFKFFSHTENKDQFRYTKIHTWFRDLGIKTGYLVFQGKALNTFPLFF